MCGLVTRLGDFREAGQFEREYGAARGALGVDPRRREEWQHTEGQQRSKVTDQECEWVVELKVIVCLSPTNLPFIN